MSLQNKNEEQPHAIPQCQIVQALCGAQTRSGKPCKAFKVRNKKRCRMHGGSAGSGAPRANRNAYKNGRYTAKWLTEKKLLTQLMRHHIDKDGLINLDVTREESLAELIADNLSFTEKIDNLLNSLCEGLISGAEHKELMRKIKMQAASREYETLIHTMDLNFSDYVLEDNSNQDKNLGS